MLHVIQWIGIEINFNKNIHKRFTLEPFSCVTHKAFSWETALKTTRIKLKFLTDFNMIIFSEEGIIGGITGVVCHYAEANNKCLFDYDKSKKSY